jgi:adenylate cyclase
VERRLVAILAADVVGYSRMMGENEEATLAMLSRCRQAIDNVIGGHRGRIFGTAGDNVIAEFPSAVEALRCAIEIQQRVEDCNRDLPDSSRMQFRIGVNLGDVIVTGSDLLGDGVNVAARLEKLAEPGSICISRSVFDQVEGKLDCHFVDLGACEVKNIARPVHVYRVHLGRANVDRSTKAAMPLTLPDKPSIAVLSFQNFSGDPEQEYFSDGITEDIITQLSRFRSLFVIARTSSFRYKGQSLKVQEIGRELGVQYLVEGSVRKAGNRVRITAQLVESETGNHLWAERYDRELEDIFALQDEVTHRVVAAVAGRLEDADRKRALRKNPDNLSAYDLLLRGKHRLDSGAREDVLAARNIFEQVLELDPNYAQAYIALAETYFYEAISSWTTAPGAAAKQLFELAQKAVKLDDQESRAHLCLAWGHWRLESNYEMAETQLEEAIALNPNDLDNYCLKALICTCAGKLEEGISCAIQALRHAPNLHEECMYSCVIAEYLLGRFDQAIAAFGRMVQPPADLYGWVAACYAQLGRDADARAAVSKLRERVLAEQAGCIEDSVEGWRAYWVRKFPSRDRSGLDHLFEGLLKAGLPV